MLKARNRTTHTPRAIEADTNGNLYVVLSNPGDIAVAAGEHTPQFSGTIYYIAIHGDDANNGLSPDNPKATFANIATIASNGDAITVDAGTYTETGIDIALDAFEIWWEIGALIEPASGTAFTLSGDSCKMKGMHNITPAAGEIGLLISGDGCHVEHGKIIGGTSGIKVTGAGVMINNYAAGFQTAKGYDLQASQARLSDCSTVGNAATYGYSISNGADTGVIKNCTSSGHATSPYHIATGSQDWTILNCSSGAGDGNRVDKDSANVWSNYTFDNRVYHTITFDASGPTSSNLFRIYGTVLITEFSGDIETVLAADIGNAYIELYDGTNTIDVTDSPGPLFNSLPVATYLHKIDDADAQIAIADSSQVRLYEDATKDGRDPNFQITAKNGTATYARIVYSGVGTSGAIHWHIQYKPLSEGGFVAPV